MRHAENGATNRAANRARETSVKTARPIASKMADTKAAMRHTTSAAMTGIKAAMRRATNAAMTGSKVNKRTAMTGSKASKRAARNAAVIIKTRARTNEAGITGKLAKTTEVIVATFAEAAAMHAAMPGMMVAAMRKATCSGRPAAIPTVNSATTTARRAMMAQKAMSEVIAETITMVVTTPAEGAETEPTTGVAAAEAVGMAVMMDGVVLEEAITMDATMGAAATGMGATLETVVVVGADMMAAADEDTGTIMRNTAATAMTIGVEATATTGTVDIIAGATIMHATISTFCIFTLLMTPGVAGTGTTVIATSVGSIAIGMLSIETTQMPILSFMMAAISPATRSGFMATFAISII